VNVTYTVSAAAATAVTLSSLSPATAAAGGAAFTLTANGQNFTPQSMVQWNGSALATTYVSATQLTAQVPATDIASAGSVPVTVSDPVNGTSSPINFTISASATTLSLASVSPMTVTVGGPSFMLTALGAGFTGTSTVQWNGTALSTTFVSSTELVAQVPATDIAALATVNVTVNDPASSVGTTPPQTVTVAAASKDAVAFQINPAHSGAVNFATLNSSFPTAPAWSVNVGGTPSYALIVNGMVYVTVRITGSSQLIALKQSTGATVWGPIVIAGDANAAYDGGRIFVISSSIGTAATMQAYDANTGDLDWSTLLAGQYAFSAALTASNGLVYTGGAGSGGTLYAVNESNGAIVWTQGVANGDNSTPAVTADGVYVTYPCQTYDFRPATGDSIWSNNTGCEGGGGATPVVANQLVYSPNGVSGYDGDTFNAETGAIAGSYVADSPSAFTASTGYFLQSGTLRGVTISNNTVLWSFAGDGTLTGSPIVVNQYVFIASSSGNLYALNGSSGVQAWEIALGSAVDASTAALPFSSLAAGDGLLVVPAGNNVICYVLSSSP
jgi:outer membrane protein assembly factor BamB